MTDPEKISEFSVLGGPLHRLGHRLGLVFWRTYTVPLGLAIAGVTWGVLLMLVLIEGASEQIFSIYAIAWHVRLLVAIPLFFLCETVVVPRMALFVRLIVDSEIVPRTALPKLSFEIARIRRWKESLLPEGMWLLASIMLLPLSMRRQMQGFSWITAIPELIGLFGEMKLTSLWYGIVCLTLYRFLLLRWLWHLILWWYILWRLSRMHLNLVPAHPDGAAGLGFLEIVHTGFIPLILAISAVQSASFAESISMGAIPFEGIYPAVVTTFVVIILLFVGPLCIFAFKLRACKIMGWADYMHLGSRYVNAFERKWLISDKRRIPGEVLLGSPDIQSLADLHNSVDIVKNMRLAPMSKQLVLKLGAAMLLPLLPLLLFIYPAHDLIQTLLKMVLSL